ncbi:MAG: TonB-dependent receptor plug domain-containing protein [Thermodesulfobacteriota bacterium]
MQKYLIFFFSALLYSNAGYTQENVLDTVIVEDYSLLSPVNYPTSFSTIIELEEFEGQFETTSELINLSPGVTVRDFGGFGQLKTVSIRGSSNDQVVIMLDGIRINNSLGGGVDLSTIPAGYIERIEVVRGGSSAVAGTDAIGGLINIITKKTGEPFTSAYATYGSFNTFLINAANAGKIGNLEYLLSFNHAQTDGDFEFRSVNNLTLKRINNDFKSESFLAKFDYKLDDWKIELLNEFYYDDKGVPGLGEFQSDSARQEDIRNFTTLRFTKYEFLNKNTDFEFIVFNNFDYLKFQDPTPTVGIPVDTKSKLNEIGFRPTVSFYPNEYYSLNSFAEFKNEKLNNSDFNNPRRNTLSYFLGNELFLYNQKLLIDLLTRIDFIFTEGTEDSFDFAFSPKLGIKFNAYKNLYIKSNISRSFRVPNFSELFFPDEVFIGGNPDLNNEKSIDFDIGISYIKPKLSFELNYFLRHVDDLILFVFISAQRIEPRNVGKTFENGIESTIIFNPTEYLSIYGAYTFLDGTLDDTGAQLPGRPRNQFDISAAFEKYNFKFYSETHFVDKIPLTVFKNSRTTDARITFDAGIKYSWKKYYANLESKNLFNNLDVRDAFDFPLPGRTVFFTLGLNI